jgi:sulfate adenylyltransferase subunit 2
MSWISDDGGQYLILDDDRMLPFLSETERASLAIRPLRCRTLGCYPQTGAVLSDATSLQDVIQELIESKTSEREGRMLDKDQVGSMEKKKREGYF